MAGKKKPPKTHPYAELGLNERQSLFVKVYCSPENNLNATRAYREVYDPDDEKDDNTLYVNASRLLSNAKVAKAVEIERNKRLADHEEIGKQLIKSWIEEINTDRCDVISPSDLHNMPHEVRIQVNGIEETKDGYKIKWTCKEKAKAALAKAIGLDLTIEKQVGEGFVSLIDKLKEEAKNE